MKKDIELVVEENSLLLEFLLKLNKSRKEIKSLLKYGNIYINGKSTTQYDHKLFIGQKITIRQSKVNNKLLDIMYEDENIIVINKPYGLLSISTDNEKDNTAYKMVMEYLKFNNPNSKVFIVHRLDRDTSGILLFAKNEKIKHMLQNNWDSIVKKRTYIAVVEGNVEKNSDTITSWLKEVNLMVYSSSKGEGQKAVTHYKKLKSNDKYSLLEINIETGRKNQIRVHMKDINHSIIGDKKYGSNINPIKRLALHANTLEFINPINKELMRFESDIPNEFLKLF
jgi:23S rRNA pseudouridine1911/1915/1917 synthase